MLNVRDWLGHDNQLGIDIWENKYRFEGETVEQFANRVAGGNEALAQLVLDCKYLFGGRALANRGTGRKGSMFNCYSSGYAPDDIEGIMTLNSNLALTYKAQGGQGVSLSHIRPQGTPIGNEFESDGIVPFMEIFNATTASISQGGARKGALMMSLDIMHKEAETFITIKSNEDKITKANLSLEIDDTFMAAVDQYYKTGEVITIHETRFYNGHKVEYDVTPIELYKLMIETVYDWGEPGCIFTERFRNYNLMEYDDDYQIETCNPCGEQPLKKNACCNLGSLNLAAFVKDPYTASAEFDWDAFLEAVPIAVEALDDIINENAVNHAIQEQADNSLNYRNIGLGVMGYGTALFKLGLKYGSREANSFTEDLFGMMMAMALSASADLAREKGAFPKCKNNLIVESNIIQNLYAAGYIDRHLIEHIKKDGLRNCSLLSVAPTGSIANTLAITGGCEPEFALSYTRRTDNLKDSYEVYCGAVREYWDVNNIPEEERNIASLPDYFVTSADIAWQDRVEVQAIMQKYVDTAISSTVNLPKETTMEEIEQIYLEAWKKGLKGITVFRDGCKRLGILTTESQTENNASKHSQLGRGDIIGTDDDVVGKKRKLITGCGSLHCTAFFDPITGDLLETYLSKGSTGGCNNFMIGLSRMISLAARGGVPVESIIDQLDSCGTCPSYAVRRATKGDTSIGSCCPIAIGNALKDMHAEMMSELGTDVCDELCEETAMDPAPIVVEEIDNAVICPQCGARLVQEGGCINCKSCGWDKCEY